MKLSNNELAFQNSFSRYLVITKDLQMCSLLNCVHRPATVCITQVGVIYPQQDLSAVYHLLTPSDCCDKCALTIGCVAWDFLLDSKSCLMKSGLPTASRKMPYINAVSGIRK